MVRAAMAFFLVLALLAGAVLPFQAGINAQLRLTVGHPILTALVSFAVGTAALAAWCVVGQVPLPTGATLARGTWWHWFGGLLGALYISATVVLAPRLGATALVALIVAGQLLASVLLDHYGLVGYARRPADVTRVLGVVLLMAGVLLVVRK